MPDRSEDVKENRAVVYKHAGTPLRMISKEIDLSHCYKDDEIVVKIHAAALNPIDFLVHEFCPSRVLGGSDKGYGHDFSGVIVRRGSAVDPKWSIDTKICGNFRHLLGPQGSLSNYLVIKPESNKSMAVLQEWKKPAKTNAGEEVNEYVKNAAWPLVFGTAYCVLHDYNQNLGPDSKILVIGASTSVSNAFIQIAKNKLKVGTVVGVCSTAAVKYNKELGFDHLITYDNGKDLDTNVHEFMKAEFEPQERFDLIFDSVGNSDLHPNITDFLKPRGSPSNPYFITVVGSKKANYQNPDIWSILPLKQMVQSYNPFRAFDFSFMGLPARWDFMEVASQMLIEGTYVPRIDSVYKFDDFQSAVDRLRSNKAKGKVTLRILE